MAFSKYIILGPQFTLGRYRSVMIPNNWTSLSDREKVIHILTLARRAGRTDPEMTWITTATFYDVGVFLFRNEMSWLERRGNYTIEKEPIGGIRYDGKSRAWFKYRLIRIPGEAPVNENFNLFQ